MKSPLRDERAWLDDLSPQEFDEYERRYKWIAEQARPEQLTPPGAWKTWLYLAGRGAGKTRTAAEDVSAYGLDNPKSRIAVVAETFADGRDVCVEGESGLLSVLPTSSVRHWNRSLGELILTNGTGYRLYSGDRPNQLRGPQHHRAWTDELAKYQYPDETWTQLQLGLRLGGDPRNVVSTTPRPIPLIKDLVGRDNVVVTAGSTFDNAENLAESFLAEVRLQYEGTKLGEQELYGRIVELDGEAIFQRKWWREPGTRYPLEDGWFKNRVRRRYLVYDTNYKDTDSSAFTARVVLEILEDYRITVREVWRERFIFPELYAEIEGAARRHNEDGLLAGVIVEDRASGISAVQSLRLQAPSWLAKLIRPFAPPGSKDEKCRQAATWCRIPGIVLLPHEAPFLFDFEEELFAAYPEYEDQRDAFTLGLLFLEEFLAESAARVPTEAA